MDLVATEFLKLRTQRAMQILLLVSLLLTVGGFVLFAFGLRSQTMAELALGTDVIQRQLLGTGAGATLIIIFAVVGITSEYRHDTITWSFLGTPERYKVLLAKLVTYALVAVAYGIIVACLVTAGVLVLLQIENLPLVVPWSRIVTDYLRDFLSLAISAGFGFAIGAIVVNQVVAIVVVLLEPAVSALALGLFPKIGRFLPSQAGAAFLADQRFPQDGFLSPGMGGLVIAAWFVALMAVAIYLTRRRDII